MTPFFGLLSSPVNLNITCNHKVGGSKQVGNGADALPGALNENIGRKTQRAARKPNLHKGKPNAKNETQGKDKNLACRTKT